MEIELGNTANDARKSLILRNVFYIKEIELTLVSVSPLDEAEITSVFSDGSVKLMDRQEKHSLLGIGERKSHGLFTFKIVSPSQDGFANAIWNKKEGVQDSHNRLGNANLQTVEAMCSTQRYGISFRDKRVEQDC